ncbi:hypothetical protein E3U55_07470 [Filobacillus milosensis]|uniref:Uncharacterized protein n=1 Tax=Filobacillus milosensis TaxID=94137 RepID=A0A4Y8ILL6_9BACI|nr:hypothetical protein [Filobacillus milosensis]TFB22133.1 hypothetical protein E3U55_07470 [Filobacillus milosensis]
MKRVLLLMLIVFAVSTNGEVSATSYETLEPQKVVDRAEIIVIGQYNFESNPEESDFIYRGYKFNVEQVIDGDVHDKFIAGIDIYDVSWAKEFQKEGGKFLLLLEQAEFADYTIPVVAQNGMVKILDGKVVENNSKRLFYEEFLEENSSVTSVKENSNLTLLLPMSLAILSLIFII